MIELINRNLNIHQVLKEKLNVFKEIFIEYYGEENREFIEDKFSHLSTIGFVPTDSLRTYLSDLEKEISKSILSKQDFGSFPLNEKDLFDNNRLEYYSLMPIGKCERFINYIKVDKENRFENYKNEIFDDLHQYVPDMTKEEYERIWQTGQFPDWINKLPLWIQNRFNYYCTEEGYKNEVEMIFNNAKPILEKLYPGINIDNFDNLLNENSQLTEQFIKICESIRNGKDEYETQKKQYSEYYSQIEEKSKLSSELSDKYFKMFIAENFDLIPAEERDEVREIIKTNSYYKLSDKVCSIFGNGLLSNYSVSIHAFSTAAEEKLNSQDTTTSTKKSIISSRIKFFKDNGIDLGDNYDAYIENEEAKKIWPSMERVDKLEDSYNQIKNKYNNQLYTSLSIHKKLREEIDQLGLLGKDDNFDAAMHTRPTTCVAPNLIDGPNGLELFSLVFVIPDSDGKYTDHKIIHELNHIVELYLSNINSDNTYDAICGWDIIDGKFNDSREDVDTITKEKVRPYELFNEIINEIIAQEISELMSKKGIVICDNEENTSYTRCTSYEKTFFIVKDFYKEFKDVIIKSRHNGNIQAIFDEVGKENFDALNELFAVYKENFNEFSFMQATKDFRENKDTEESRKLKEIISKRDEILNKMRMHSAMKASQIQEQAIESNYQMQ